MLRSLTRALCFTLATVSGSAVLIAVAGQTPDSNAYLELVDRYQRGGHDDAVASIMLWNPEDVRRAVPGELVEQLSAQRLRAVAMLHVEAMLRGGSVDALLPAAQGAVFRLGIKDDKDDTEFIILWRIVAASYALWRNGLVQAGQLLGQPAKWDARLNMLDGCLKEFTATEGWSGSAPMTMRGETTSSRWNGFGIQNNSRRTMLLGAEARYRSALGSSPGLVEARLRLGRVLAIMDRPADARVELERVVREAPHSYLKYLAALFLGNLDERDGRFDNARERYLAALAEYPESQAARLALGHLLEAQGSPDEGWAEVRRIFSDANNPGSAARDPWWMYRHGQAWQFAELVDRLREAVRR